ncbi:hypothetical protein HYH03_001150 [Edaphochlamys debaryana]|uniref:Uncharacterized protein n=1 Tax=Edaphochlamys debaryana TaxID=47281 RepID=A0A835YEH3_9CHLO|nr:hypothetical protein HYH03_001150 [Edaphochlamys debaryana]|eukprot:KAG2501360.1 hypothetical protein HYH03_001150 [Edaphochlamys debaryana]
MFASARASVCGRLGTTRAAWGGRGRAVCVAGPLAAAPPGQGPPANPVTEALYNPTLLAQIWPLGKGASSFRLVSKDARAAFDAACGGLLAFGPQQQRLRPSQALGWALGMLRRGRRPWSVRIEIEEDSRPQDWRQGVLDLLQAMPQLSGRPGEGVASLELPAGLLSPSTAPLIAGAVPNLSRLELAEAGKLSPDASHEAARGLALLLTGAEDSERASAAAGSGEEAGGGPNGGTSTASPVPVLTSLSALYLSESYIRNTLERLPPGFVSVLRHAVQLRTLGFPGRFDKLSGWYYVRGQAGGSRRAVEELASLTQLTALSLHSCAATLLPVLTGALTRLTSLELQTQEYDDPALSPALFAPLQGLQRLEIPCASLEVTGLAEALSSLTRLSVGGFTLPAQELSQPLTSIPRWRLPAGLRELGLRGSWMPPEALRFVRRNEFDIDEDWSQDISISFNAATPCHLLTPVGGAAGTGPGRPNHGRWLREVAALRPSHLSLEGISLSYQDVETISAEMVDLEVLALIQPSELCFPALPLLAGLPRVESIGLDTMPLCGDDEFSEELRDQALESLVALAGALPRGRKVEVYLNCWDGMESEEWERVKELATSAQEMAEWEYPECGPDVIVLATTGELEDESEAEESLDGDRRGSALSIVDHIGPHKLGDMNAQVAETGSAACSKRRRLGAAPSGQGPPANPVTAVLFNPTLLAKIRPVGEREVAQAQSRILPCTDLHKCLGTFRLVSKDARASFDAACEAPLAFGPQRQICMWDPEDGDKVEGPSPSQAVDWALGMLRRGRRPGAVRCWADKRICPAKWRQGVAEGGGRASAGASGEAASGAPSPLLPRLTALSLSSRYGIDSPKSLPPGFGPVVRKATQLRTLDFGGYCGGRGSSSVLPEDDAEDNRRAVEELASLTQLTALSLQSCAVQLLPVLTSALTRLTSLELSGQREPLPAALFAPLQGLQRLEVPYASLEVTGLTEALTSLTRLSVGSFTFADEASEQPLTSIPPWTLPAGLRELGLGTNGNDWYMSPEVLAGLELHPGLRFDPNSNHSSFVLHPGRHTAPPVEEEGFAGTELLPAAEEALCGALSFVRRHGLFEGGEVTIAYREEEDDRLLQPVGGATGTGPGRPNHGRWLREVAALGPSRLVLEGFELSYQDVETMRDGLEDLETLLLEAPSKLPLPALPLLGSLTHLKELHLDATPWAEDDEDGIELRGQALASIVALGRALPHDRRLTIHQDAARPGAMPQERLRQMGLRAVADMEAWGVDRISIMVDGWYVHVDPDGDD